MDYTITALSVPIYQPVVKVLFWLGLGLMARNFLCAKPVNALDKPKQLG